MAAIAWDRLLETYYKRGASLALLVQGSPPLLRIGQEWRSLQVPPLTRDSIHALVAERMGKQPPEIIDGYACCDFWYGEIGFFRAMAFGYPDTTTLVVSQCGQIRLPPR
jgi:Tfp pilus assembly ATPase PilU